MTDMVEKVARAIYKDAMNRSPQGHDWPGFDQLFPDTEGHIQAMARAAISALMEPTEKMRQAGYLREEEIREWVFEQDHSAPYYLETWQAMLKAALDD